MDLKFLLCFVMIAPIFGDNLRPQNPNPQQMMELDRARSAWNFGGHPHPNNKRLALAQWGRPRSSLPASAIANRRQGTQPKATGSSKKKSARSQPAPHFGSPAQPRQHKSHPKAIKPGKRTKFSRNAQSQSSSSIPKSKAPQTVSQAYYPHPFYNNHQQHPSHPSWPRGSRMFESRSDTIMNKFRKEDLWHLDKGEGYQLKNEDLEYDEFLRNYNKVGIESTNSIDNQHEEGPEHEHEHNTEEDHFHQHKLEQEAEDLIKNAEDVICNKNHQTGEENASNHIHHHHHYTEGKGASHKEEEKKKPAPNMLTIAPLPRIHNPIPLGCLLTVPVFHPIRPRSHVACLLSIPGTPNLMKRRRRRSADSQQQQLQQPQPIMGQPQTQQQIMQMLTGNQRMSGMSPVGSRKHYSSHMGNGKQPLTQQQMSGNLKVPATIIAPPKFDKSDLLSMLMGSGGVNPNDMGTILATNTRYVRFGRGLPNSGGGGTRQGRNLQWFPESSNNQLPNNNNKPSHPSVNSMPPPPSVSTANNQQPYSSSSNQMPSIHLPPQQSSSYMTNQNHYSTPSYPQVQQAQTSNRLPPPPPPPSYKINMPAQQQQQLHQRQQLSNTATPPLPLTLNIQIAPMGSRPSSSRGPVITVSSSQQQQQQQAPISSASHPYQTVASPPTSSPEKSQNKYSEDFKYTEYWKPVYKEKAKPQKPYKQYDYYSQKYNDDMTSSSESKLYYSKVKKPAAAAASSEDFSEDSNFPSYVEENIETVPPVEYYDNSIQNMDTEYVGESSGGFYDHDNDYSQASLRNGLADQHIDSGNNNFKAFSFAVKNNNNNEKNNAYELDMSSSSSADYDDLSFLPHPIADDIPFTDGYDTEAAALTTSTASGDDLRMAETVSSRNQNPDNSYYYSVVKKLTGYIPDPIYINVPKDSPLSNEIKK